jgi:hypothetical protein
MVFGVVSVALIWKRLYNRDLPFKQQMMPFWLIMLMVLASIGKQTVQLERCCQHTLVSLTDLQPNKQQFMLTCILPGHRVSVAGQTAPAWHGPAQHRG